MNYLVTVSKQGYVPRTTHLREKNSLRIKTVHNRWAKVWMRTLNILNRFLSDMVFQTIMINNHIFVEACFYFEIYSNLPVKMYCRFSRFCYFYLLMIKIICQIEFSGCTYNFHKNNRPIFYEWNYFCHPYHNPANIVFVS
jgi:hypothetical protein